MPVLTSLLLHEKFTWPDFGRVYNITIYHPLLCPRQHIEWHYVYVYLGDWLNWCYCLVYVLSLGP